MNVVVTGGAGFIGSALSEEMVRLGWEVTVFDNLSSGSLRNLSRLDQLSQSRTRVIIGDCTRLDDMKRAVQDSDIVFHFAANPEVRIELNSPTQCFQQNVYATHTVLEAFRESRARMMVFASTSTVYGDARILPTPEDYAPLQPISIYGASKLAGEALVGAYCRSFNKHAIIVRLANVIGPKSTHGVVSEFFAMLDKRPKELPILGDGSQTKSYIYIDDCVSAIMATLAHSNSSVEVFNIGSEDSISVKTIGSIVAGLMGLPDTQLKFNGGLGDGRGWIGDVKTMLLDLTKLKSTGWRARLDSRGAVEETVKHMFQDRSVHLPNEVADTVKIP
ncbi:MAG TPA: NAD-dependent epimerase/dehydratase family protein [Candidatus Bathyarchaeia archaeon]|nr:NAD-dependent epimerase/dehydratase family protein [Candidatus Bathyarchaeia archaeon]